jgi:hypothetical protein
VSRGGDVTPITKEMQTRRVWTCRAGDENCTRSAPCRSCLGRRNRRSGMVKQRQAKKMAGIPDNRFHGADGNEEMWVGRVRAEVKSGAQAGPVWTRYFAAESQANGTKRVGDSRPFMALFMPKGLNDGVVAIRLTQLRQVVEALAEQMGESA